jgi:hypothetical protein
MPSCAETESLNAFFFSLFVNPIDGMRGQWQKYQTVGSNAIM